MTKKRVIVLVIIFVLLICLGLLGVFYWKSKKSSKPQNEIKIVDSIDEYGYSIKENDSDLKREKFKELKKILSSDEINYEDYASKLAELFVVDVYDLNSKINKYDVGGLEYVLDDNKETLKLKLQDSLYNNIEDNIDKNRKQDLPIVTAVKAEEIKKETFKIKNIDYDCYSMKITIDYKKDLGYDSNVSVKVIKKDNKLYVALVEPI